ncbi:MAG: family 78 glycoside hydrolase catalytic domain [Ignavibacteriae bacterium]|nr:family 78 glycoside hydrolase catalytic domain [Ignavibacteriota bacterium]
MTDATAGPKQRPMHAALAGQWIWCSGEEQPKNFYLHLRRSFDLPAGIRQGVIAVTADSRYQLFVNGSRVAFGPARSDRRWQCVDEWDITRYLRPGPNVIAALVHHYGEWTFSYMLGRGGFLADITVTHEGGETIRIGTDASWRVCPARSWDRRLPRMSIQLGFAEVYDARKELEGWTLAETDDAGWEHAVVLGPPGMEPWPQLVPRGIPAMTELPLDPVRVIDTGCVGQPVTGHYVDLHRVVWCARYGVAYLGTYIWSPDEMDLEIRAGSQDAVKVWFNGGLVIDHLVKREPAPDQESAPVRLRQGWNVVLAKVVQDEGQWHFLFRLEGPGSERCVYARSMGQEPPSEEDMAPWWLLGPVHAESMTLGFETVYPPEHHWDPATAVHLSDGTILPWITAGVSRESQVTAIMMSREPRIAPEHPRIIDASGLTGGGAGATFVPGDEPGAYVVLDFGKEVAGFPVLEISGAAGGEIIDIGYSEFLSGPDGTVLSPAAGLTGVVNCDRGAVHYADRYICKPGPQSFRTFDKRAFRFMQVDVRALKQPLRLGAVRLILSTYPVEYAGGFECSDAVLNRIWDVGRWTVQLNMEDAYTDCPWRERGQWWGDARIQALVNYYAFGDLALIGRGIRSVAQSQDAEGWTRGIYPTDWSYAILPTFSLLWIISVHDYIQHAGDRALPGEVFAEMERVIEACERYRAEHGLLRDMPHWMFVDWAAGIDTTGESAAANALYFGALRALEGIARYLGRPVVAGRYAAIADEVRSGMKRILWDEERKCFRENWKEGVLSKDVSEQANCWAVAFGVVEGDDAVTLLHAVRNDGQANVVTGSPYFAFYMLDMFARAGEHRAMLDFIRERWTRMLEWGATTWWETWEPNVSHCHGWSAGPTYYLQSEILGVKPGTPGWEEITIEPHPAGLAWARGTVPTPRGTVTVEWKQENGLMVRIDVPAPSRVRLAGPGTAVVTRVVGGEGKPWVPEQHVGDRGYTVYLVPEPGVYEFRSREEPMLGG